MDNFTDSRFGKFTASEISRLLKSSRKKDEVFGDGARTYIDEKIAELVTGETKPQVHTTATEWGNKHEADAIKWFEILKGKKLIHHGTANYKFYPYKGNGGCSPDAIVMELNKKEAIVEVKCPYVSANHIRYLCVEGGQQERQQWLKENEFDYYAQCQMEMMCVEVPLCYFISYDPRTIEPEHRMSVFELHADNELQQSIDERIGLATDILIEKWERLKVIKKVTLHDNINGSNLKVVEKI